MTFEDSVFLSVTTDRERFELNAFFQKINELNKERKLMVSTSILICLRYIWITN